MRFLDALLLARTKFKTRKVRSILTALAAGFMLTILMIGSFMATGVRNSIASVGGEILEDRIFARQYSFGFSLDGEPLDYQTGDEFLSDINAANANADRVYVEINPGADFQVEGQDQDARDFNLFNFEEPFNVFGRSSDLVEPYVTEGYSLDYLEGDPIPLVLSTDYVIQQKNIRFGADESAADRLGRINDARQEFIGTEITANITAFGDDFNAGIPPWAQEQDATEGSEQETYSQTFTVVGFSPAGSSLLEASPGSLAPLEILKNTQLADLYEEGTNKNTTYFIEFSSVLDRDQYIDSQCSASDFDCNSPAEAWNDPLAKFNQLFGEFLGFFRYVIIFFATIVAVSMFVTTSKVVADSERETGVFRAIGAKRIDIVKIYFIYALLIATAAFALTLVISILFGLYLTSRFGQSFAFQIAQYTGSGDVDVVRLVAFDPQHMLVIYSIGVAAAILGAALPIINAVRRDPIKAMRDE